MSALCIKKTNGGGFLEGIIVSKLIDEVMSESFLQSPKVWAFVMILGFWILVVFNRDARGETGSILVSNFSKEFSEE